MFIKTTKANHGRCGSLVEPVFSDHKWHSERSSGAPRPVSRILLGRTSSWHIPWTWFSGQRTAAQTPTSRSLLPTCWPDPEAASSRGTCRRGPGQGAAACFNSSNCCFPMGLRINAAEGTQWPWLLILSGSSWVEFLPGRDVGTTCERGCWLQGPGAGAQRGCAMRWFRGAFKYSDFQAPLTTS